jgi:hypothetical protein
VGFEAIPERDRWVPFLDDNFEILKASKESRGILLIQRAVTLTGFSRARSRPE